MTSPYVALPSKQFWKTGVGHHTADTVEGIYIKRFAIDGLKIATAGSCFAQHIATHLRRAGYTVIDKEPPPKRCLSSVARHYQYGIYSARYGNIYSTRHLLQLTQESIGRFAPPEDALIWTRDGRYFDALRPSVEPNGLPSADTMLAQRAYHLRCFRRVLRDADLFIFTLGLTETWMHSSGLAYPTAPGTIAGEYDPTIHEFRNLSYQDIYDDFVAFRKLAHSVNKGMKFLLTVSPVPLTATAENRHVLVSTVQSKAVLRAVAGQLYQDFSDIDYFPSFDLLSTPFLGNPLFESNRRTVQDSGVRTVMRHFFAQHRPKVASKKSARIDDVHCEDTMLEAFA